LSIFFFFSFFFLFLLLLYVCLLGIFEIVSHELFAWGASKLISACRVTRVTGVSQQHQACCSIILPFSKLHIMVPGFK
jgi:hypothetical protein